MRNQHQKRAPVDLYNTSYDNFSAAVQSEVRVATYGEDLGQSSWMTAEELRKFVRWLRLRPSSHVLEVGSGSGGAALFIARNVSCRITGLDVNDYGVKNANALACREKLDTLVHFQVADAAQALPFDEETFDAVFSNDAICHLPRRREVLQDWFRVLKPGGQILFTDAMVMTGALSNEEIATRSSIGFYLFLAPGENEKLLRASGFELVRTSDVTANAARVSKRWYEARAQHAVALAGIEGKTNFEGLQKFLSCVHAVSSEGRLSRFAYLARKPKLGRRQKGATSRLRGRKR